MSAYTTSLLLDHLPGRPTKVVLWEELHWMIVHEDPSLTVTVPYGFIHDSASVPRFLRWLISPMDGDIIKPAAGHDWLYGAQTFDQRSCSRREADREFRKMMLADNSTQLRAWAAWSAIRIGGWWRWAHPNEPTFADIKNRSTTGSS